MHVFKSVPFTAIVLVIIILKYYSPSSGNNKCILLKYLRPSLKISIFPNLCVFSTVHSASSVVTDPSDTAVCHLLVTCSDHSTSHGFI